MTSVATLRRETYRTGHMGAIGDILRQTENRMRSAHATHLGYPYNLVGYSPVPASLGGYLVNNLGDPYAVAAGAAAAKGRSKADEKSGDHHEAHIAGNALLKGCANRRCID